MVSKERGTSFLLFNEAIQILILEQLDTTALYRLCLVSRETYEMAWPILWREIDFVNVYDADGKFRNYRSIQDWQWRFFSACDFLIRDQPDRWRVLAAQVTSLLLTRVYRPIESHLTDNEMLRIGCSLSDYDFIVLRIVSHFINLRKLSLFVWYDHFRGDFTANVAWKQNLNKITTLKIGGEIADSTISLMLHNPEILEELSLINIIQISRLPYFQVNSPLFLRPLVDRFSNLKTLHLSKCAEQNLYGELESLEEFRLLLRRVNRTLVHLTLEMCYERDGRGGPDDVFHGRCKDFVVQFRRVIRPILIGWKFKKLECLTLIGLYVMEPLEKLGRNKVVHLLGRRVEEHRAPNSRGYPPPSGVFSDSYLVPSNN